MSFEELTELATDSGLARMGIRPPLRAYIRDVWRCRDFTRILATSKAYARNQNNYLGQLWAVLNPTLNAVTYIVIFGFMMDSGAGLQNRISFIVIGTFTYRFFTQSITGGAKAIRGNIGLVRSMHFPRAVLPIASVYSELTTTIPAVVVMCVIAYGSGFLPSMGPVAITPSWLLMPFAIALLWLFNTGCAFFMARWVAVTPDIQNMIGFVTRFIMYGSGVLFSISHFVKNAFIANLLNYQPIGVYLHLVRMCLLQEPTVPYVPTLWLWGIGWALLALVWGFLFFWRGEERYGRD